jgi:hypothetical protein
MEWFIVIYVLSLISSTFIVVKAKKSKESYEDTSGLSILALVPILNTTLALVVGFDLLTDWLAEKV